MTKIKQQHRHFVVAPLFALVLLGSSMHAFVDGTHELTGSVITQWADDQIIVVDSDVQIVASEGAEVDASEPLSSLEAGSVVVRSAGISTLRIGKTLMLGIDGAFHASSYGSSISIAALTTPVLVKQGKRLMLIPMGRQWRSRGVLPGLEAGYGFWSSSRETQVVPHQFLRDQLKRLSVLPPIEPTSLPEARLVPYILQASDAVLLPHARKRQRMHALQQTVGMLRRAMETNDVDRVVDMLSDAETADLLSTDHGRAMIALLLAYTDVPTAIRMPLIEVLVADADIRLAAGIHPRYSAEVWLAPSASSSREARVLSWLLLPESDFLPQAHSSLAIAHWRSDIADALSTMHDAPALLDVLLDRVGKAIERMEKSHYPQRARLYGGALVGIAAEYETQLSSQSHMVLEKLRSLETVDLEAVELPEVQKAEEPEDTSASDDVSDAEDALPEEEVLARAEEILNEAGALMTMKTKIIPAESNTVLVTDIVFSNPDKDRTFDFLLDVVRGEIRDVQEGANSYPYALWVEDFVNWARK